MVLGLLLSGNAFAEIFNLKCMVVESKIGNGDLCNNCVEDDGLSIDIKNKKILNKCIVVPLGNTVSSTIEYLNSKYNLKLSCFLEGFPHPSGANAGKNIQFKKNKKKMILTLKNKKNQT